MVRRSFGAARFRTDGDILALAYDDDTGRIWSVEDPGVLRSWDESGNSLTRQFLMDLETTWTFSSGAKLLAAACDELLVWEVATRKLLARSEVPSWVTAVAFHPSLLQIATGHDDGVVRLWNPATEELIAEFGDHTLPISALAFDGTGTVLASAGEDRDIKLFDTKTQTLIRSLKGHTDRIPGLAWHPAGKLIISVGWDATARVWDVATGEPRILLNTHDDQVEALTFSNDGTLFATADSASIVHIWGDLLAAQTLHKVQGFSDEVHALAFRADGLRLAVGGSDRVVHIYDPRSGQLLAGRPTDSRHTIAIWKDGNHQFLVSSAGEGGLIICDATSGKSHTSPFAGGEYLCVAASPNGRWLAAISGKAELCVWDRTSQQMRIVDGPKTAPTHLTFSRDSKLISGSVSREGTAWLWNVETLEPQLLVVEAAEGASVEATAFHPNGNMLLCGGIDYLSTSGSTGAVCQWDLIEKIRKHSIPHGAICLTYNPEGSRFAFGTPDGRVMVHSSDTGEQLLELEFAEDHRVDALEFSNDGGRLFAVSDAGLMRVWDASTGEVLAVREIAGPVHQLVAFGDDTIYAAHGNGTISEMSIEQMIGDS